MSIDDGELKISRKERLHAVKKFLRGEDSLYEFFGTLNTFFSLAATLIRPARTPRIFIKKSSSWLAGGTTTDGVSSDAASVFDFPLKIVLPDLLTPLTSPGI